MQSALPALEPPPEYDEETSVEYAAVVVSNASGTKRRRITTFKQHSLLRYTVGKPRTPKEIPSVVEVRLQQYADPYYFPGRVQRRVDHYRFPYRGAASVRLAEVLCRRFAPLVNVEVEDRLGSNRGSVFNRITAVMWCEYNVTVGFSDGHRRVFVATEFLDGCADHDTFGVNYWEALRRITEGSVILHGLHARLGCESSVHRASQHVLYEREVWRMIMSYLR